MRELIKDDELLHKYFPEEFFSGRTIKRSYFFGVINTLYPGYLDNLISHANDVRINKTNSNDEEQTILATDRWAYELTAINFYSKVS